MQNLIKETGLTNKQFAEYYNIPYNTVLQWSKGIRKAPEYLVKIIKKNRELKTNGLQIPLGKEFFHIGIKTKYGYTEYTVETEELRDQIEREYKANNAALKITKKNFIQIY